MSLNGLIEPMYTAVDHQWMAEALAEAHKALYLANPNPRVGCVIVKDGQVIEYDAKPSKEMLTKFLNTML